MSRIVAFTYDVRIDRRILLQLRSLQSLGHEIILYANEGDAAQDPADLDIRRLITASVRGRAGFLFGMLGRLRGLAPAALSWLMPLVRPLAWAAMRGKPDAAYQQLFADSIADAPAADLYIAYDLPMLPVAAAARARHGGMLLYDSHELFCEQQFSKFECAMWRRVESAYIAQADRVLTVNASIARELERRYGIARVGVVQNAEWLPNEFPIREPLFHRAFGLPENARILLYQGRISAGRNLATLVAAMRQVTMSQLHLVFLGSGPLVESLRAQVKRLGLTERVYFHPEVPQDTLLRYTMAADLGVIPYVADCLNNRLCTPNKLFEFIIAGLPVLGSDLPEIRALVERYGLGEVCAMEQANMLATAIDGLMQAEKLAALRSTIKAARSQVNWQQESTKFLEVVTPLLTDRC